MNTPSITIVDSNRIPDTIISCIIRNLPLLAGITEQEKLNLLKSGHIRKFQPAEYLFMHGDPITGIYIICSGRVQLFRENREGRGKTTGIRAAGQTLGETEVFGAGGRHQVNALALTEVSTIVLPVSWLKETLRKYPPVALNLLAMIARHICELKIEAED